MFKLSIQADTDVATITNTIPFEVELNEEKILSFAKIQK